MLIRMAVLLMLGMVWLPSLHAQGARMLCTNAARSHWMSWQEIETRLIDQGQRMVRLRIAADRCLAVLALDSRGDYSEFLMDPVNGKILQKARAPEPRSPGILPWRMKN